MARSVSYLSNAQEKTFFPFETEDEFDWENMKENLVSALCEIFPSLHEPNRDRWDDMETKILLENNLVEIGLSEYCGLVSLSIRPLGYDGWTKDLSPFAAQWIRRTWGKMVAAIPYETYYKAATFSNGEAIYKPTPSL